VWRLSPEAASTSSSVRMAVSSSWSSPPARGSSHEQLLKMELSLGDVAPARERGARGQMAVRPDGLGPKRARRRARRGFIGRDAGARAQPFANFSAAAARGETSTSAGRTRASKSSSLRAPASLSAWVAQNSPVETSTQAAPSRRRRVRRRREVRRRGFEQLVLDDGSRVTTRTIPRRHELLGLGRLLHLLGDGDAMPGAQQLGDVVLSLMKRDAAHRHVLARRQHQSSSGAAARRRAEHLIEVAEPEEKDRLRVGGLEFPGTAHHGSVGQRGHRRRERHDPLF